MSHHQGIGTPEVRILVRAVWTLALNTISADKGITVRTFLWASDNGLTLFAREMIHQLLRNFGSDVALTQFRI